MPDRRPNHVLPVPLAKAYRLLNHGPTVLVSASLDGRRNVMAAAWNMALDYEPCKVAVVLDKSSYTRTLVGHTGRFALCVPARAIAAQVMAVGTTSARDIDHSRHGDKFDAFGIDSFTGADAGLPLVAGCVAWLECTAIPEPHNEQRYDLFIGEATAAWADARVFSNGHWTYDEQTPPELQTLHYVAGGRFLSVGNGFTVAVPPAPA